ncbi:inactive tyrosine-protein kinase PEAK1 [Genypterus blacodes]|uniref:inactive tyrosine-protein kinase PEAK1 n=1 Tax=Genypterus blacodes TaxID=154954 RepID=UPI003F76247A
MASGSDSRAEVQPPALPVKQHRSRSSRGSSQDSDCVLLSPGGLQLQNYAFNDVFPETTDCHAAQCPIHQQEHLSYHQVRFFSDRTPPPVPKKRVARSVSHPMTDAPPPAPLQLQSRTQNFDNPLYMLAPIPHTQLYPERAEEEEASPVRKSPVLLMSLSQLCFDTADEHLLCLFSSFDNQGVVSQRIQYRHLLFLRCMAQRMEAKILQEDASDSDVGSYRPEDFLLCEGNKPKQIGDAVYYGLHSSKFPRRVLGLRVHNSTYTPPSADIRHRPPHINVQDVVVRFQPSSSLKNKSNTPDAQDPSNPLCPAAKPPCGGSTESAQALLQRGLWATVERDLPHATLEDFIQESAEPLLYERQLCVLLLQILTGSEHLCQCSSAAELRPRDVLLIWPGRGRERADNEDEEDIEWEGKGRVQLLWRMKGSPRVVLTPLPTYVPAPHPSIIRAQLGALIRHCLDRKEENLSPSLYKRGLLYLESSLQMADMLATLQVLLWGPQDPVLSHGSSRAAAVHNWLTIKRALLVMKMAEKSLVHDQSGLDWDDCLCLHFLAFTDSEAVLSAINRLRLPLSLG